MALILSYLAVFSAAIQQQLTSYEQAESL